MKNLPFSESCEQNKNPILAILSEAFADKKNVLEIGSGTGQHAIYFGQMLPHLTWQTSDLAENHDTIRAWLETSKLSNVLPPLLIDANNPDWHLPNNPDAIFSANAVHIMGWPEVENLFTGIGRNLKPGGLLCLYGPFNYGGKYTSMSNAQFDEMLKTYDPKSGIRDFEAMDKLANLQGLKLVQDFAMPANNRTLIWKKT